MIQTRVYLKKDTHQYFDDTGKQFVPVSHILSHYKDEFNSAKISGNVAGKGKFTGMSKQQVLDKWDTIAKEGTRVHDAIDDYKTSTTIKPDNEDLEPLVKSICADYRVYKRVYSEVVLYSPFFEARGLPMAGTADGPLAWSKFILDMEDYKTNPEGIDMFHKDNKYMHYPLDHLQQCKYHLYAMQLSTYGFMWEELTGMKLRSLWIRYIPLQNKLAHYRIPVPYMKSDVLSMLMDYEQWYKEHGDVPRSSVKEKEEELFKN